MCYLLFLCCEIFFAYADTLKELPLEIDFIYLGNKEICCIPKTHCIIYFIFHKPNTKF
jgi:hypothetical protein